MPQGEHSKGGSSDAPAQADAPAAAAGWLDRLVLRSHPVSAPDGLRPRLPYPFEAMRFGGGDRAGIGEAPAAGAVPASSSPVAPPPPANARQQAPAAVASRRTPPPHPDVQATGPAPPRVPAPAAPMPRTESDSPHAASTLRVEQDRPAVSAAPPQAPQWLAAAVRAPRTAPPSASASDEPAPPGRSNNAAATAPIDRQQGAREIATAQPPARERDVPPRAGQRALSRDASPAPVPPATGTPALPPLRSAARGPAPLAASAAAGTRTASVPAELTIDIHIGRIDVRAPAGPAPAPAAPRAGDALHGYLQRRGRGARS